MEPEGAPLVKPELRRRAEGSSTSPKRQCLGGKDGREVWPPIYLRSQQALQLAEIAGVEIGNGPVGDAAATPAEQVVAVACDEPRRGVTGARARPHEHVDDVQAALVDDGADA